MFDIVKSLFRQIGWRFSQVEGKDILFLSVNGRNGKIQCVVNVIETEYKFLFHSVCATDSPENKRNDISELLTRLNFGRFLGNFEMDFSDGEIRYKTSLFYRDVTPNLKLVEYLIMTNVITMDSALPGITGVIFGGMNPSDAFELTVNNIENEDSQPVIE